MVPLNLGKIYVEARRGDFQELYEGDTVYVKIYRHILKSVTMPATAVHIPARLVNITAKY